MLHDDGMRGSNADCSPLCETPGCVNSISILVKLVGRSDSGFKLTSDAVKGQKSKGHQAP